MDTRKPVRQVRRLPRAEKIGYKRIMKLRTWRVDNSLKASDVAEKVGVSESTITSLERGDTWPYPDVIEKISRLSGGQVTAADHIAAWLDKRPERRAAVDQVAA